MRQLSIEISDELAQRLEPFQNQLSELVTRLITTNLLGDTASNVVVNSTQPPPIYLEVLDFLVTRPTYEQILAFKVSERSQAQLQTLLEKNREGNLSSFETAELNLYEQLDALMTMLKARAYSAIKATSDSLNLA
ncbi:hypothetical protein I8748_29100 [Nostoc sp. CENA67]|uniref:Uncharacterized protein n=1 Tax=Amazonocrinis nigriterrae CENA67 TaxID=2794033 RepID=A0A8J7LB21_9NOST|nr:hypothetical protein [Amazonocrinis nigriterrae]MBH8566168.1 hypothetical protein [Amazonocrinis nigriterrae CENA67]